MGKTVIDNLIKRNVLIRPYSLDIDIYKEIYQSLYLTGHLINDESLNYLINEWNECKSLSIKKDLYEFIDSDVVRINLEPFSFSLKELFTIFKESSEVKLNKDYKELINKYNLNKYLKQGIPSHSNIYKEKYKPHYRVCYFKYLPFYYRVYQLSKFIEEKRLEKDDNEIIFIALEGIYKEVKQNIANKMNDVTILSDSECSINYLDKLIQTLQINEKVRISVNKDNEIIKRIIEVKDIIIIEGDYIYKSILNKYINYYALCMDNINESNYDDLIIDANILI